MFGEYTATEGVSTPAKPPAKRPKSPPKSCEEWIASQKGQTTAYALGTNAGASWPEPAPEGEELLDGSETKDGTGSILGTLESIKDDIQRHAPWDPSFLESIDKRLQAVEKSLDHHADRFVCNPRPSAKESVAGGLTNLTNITFLTELCDKDLLDAVRMQSNRTPRNRAALTNGDEKGVEDVVFPGFKDRVETVIPLPGSLEALPILDLVTKANSFPSYSVKAWRRVFYSDDTISILQNTFWYIWMDLYHPDPFSQSLLFDYVSESFASLLVSMNNVKHKDEVFMYYPGCLAQAVYSIFCHAFPKSKREINSPEFLNYITDLTSEWIAGVKCAPGSWERWPWHLINPYHTSTHRHAAERGHSSGAGSGRPPLTEKDVMQLSLFTTKSPVAGEGRRTTSGQRRSSRVQFSGVGRRSAQTRGRGTGSAHMAASTSERSLLTREMSVPSQTTIATDDRGIGQMKSLSDFQVGPGPIYECVRFSTLGRSPLLQHYLYTHNLSEVKVQHHHPVSRTQVKEVQSSDVTYKKLLKRSTDKSDQQYKAYQRLIGESAQEIAEAQKQHIAKMRSAERRNKRILQHRFEVTILAERLVSSKKEQRIKEISQLGSKDAELYY